MAHARKAIRNAVVNILLGEPQADALNPVYPITLVEDRIYPNRPTPAFESELPCISVYTPSESSEPRDGEKLPKHYDRKLEVIIELLLQAEDGFDDSVDDICEQIENLLLYRWYLKDPISEVETADNLVMKRSEIVFMGEDVKNIVAAARITLEVTYNQDVLFPSIPDDFDSMKVDYNIDSATGDGHLGAEATDEVEDIYTP